MPSPGPVGMRTAPSRSSSGAAMEVILVVDAGDLAALGHRGVNTGTTQDRVTAGAAAASARLARLPMPSSAEPLTLQMMPAARATAATSSAR